MPSNRYLPHIKKGLFTVLLFPLSAYMLISFAVASTGPYHGNAKSHIFHSPSCRYYTCKACTVTFGTREAAVQAVPEMQTLTDPSSLLLARPWPLNEVARGTTRPIR